MRESCKLKAPHANHGGKIGYQPSHAGKQALVINARSIEQQPLPPTNLASTILPTIGCSASLGGKKTFPLPHNLFGDFEEMDTLGEEMPLNQTHEIPEALGEIEIVTENEKGEIQGTALVD